MCFLCIFHMHSIKFKTLEKGSGVVSRTLVSSLQMQTAGRGKGNNKTYNSNSGYGIQMEPLKYIKNLEKSLKSWYNICVF